VDNFFYPRYPRYPQTYIYYCYIARYVLYIDTMIYAVVNTKGGVGKTTTAIHLATMLAKHASALLIDGDPQASSASWAAWRRDAGREPSPTTTVLKGKAIVTEGKSLAQGFAATVVDAGGRDSVGLRSALLLAQRAIVPVGASQLDSAAMTDLLEVVELAREYNPECLPTCKKNN
jgi:chromosome partitioning protein